MAPLSALRSNLSVGRWGRLAVILLVLGTVATIGAFAAVGGPGTAGSPIDRVLPGEQYVGQSEPGGLEGVGEGDGLGALNPGTETGVGGDLGFDKETFGSNDTSVHFTAAASRPVYWRTGAYDTYTGTGWQRPEETIPYDGPLTVEGPSGQRVEYEITLDQGATGLPTAWRPESVDADDIELTVQRAVRPTSPVPAGTSYGGASVLAPQDPTVLRASEGEIPEEIRDRYTQLPAQTPDRVGERTAAIIGDADTTYDAVAAVERWLRTEKDYSLQADTRSETIADTFIFEMEAGYCEYFATAMTTMLRTQDIPARYVVGYTSGDRTGNGEYAVRGQNAHAWVEVYFPEVGWVPFEPTPPTDRIAAEQDNLDEDRAPEDVATPEQATPRDEEPGDPDGPEPDPNGNETTNDTDEPDDIDVSLDGTATPGATVEVTVTRGDEPVVGAAVRFNGEQIGRTDDDGTVSGIVPYADELRVTVDPLVEPTERLGEPAGGPIGGAPVGGDRFYAVGARAAESGWVSQPGETFPVETNATVTVGADPRPGETVTVLATVGEIPVPEATVTVDGDPVGVTDANGRAAVTLPERSGQVTVAVERGPVSGTQTLELPELTVAVDPTLPAAVPFGSATVTVTADGDPVPGATVSVDGDAVAETGPSGTTTIGLPVSNTVSITASQYGLTDRTELSGVLRNGLLVLGGSIGAVGLVGLAAYRGRAPMAVALSRGRVLLRRVSALIARGLISAAAWLDATVRGLSRELRLLAVGQADPRKLWRRAQLWIGRKRSQVRELVGHGETTADGPDTRAPEDPERLVREAWAQLLEEMSLRRQRTRTPEELAAHAIEADGLPAGPVQTLRDAFRAVEYGSRPPDDRVEQVKQALAAIETARTEAAAEANADEPGRR